MEELEYVPHNLGKLHNDNTEYIRAGEVSNEEILQAIYDFLNETIGKNPTFTVRDIYRKLGFRRNIRINHSLTGRILYVVNENNFEEIPNRTPHRYRLKSSC